MDKSLEILLAIQRDVAEIRRKTIQTEQALETLPCAPILPDPNAPTPTCVLAIHIENLGRQLEHIQTTDLPDIRRQVAPLNWVRKGRNKVALVLLILGIGIGGVLLGEVVKNAVFPTPAAISQEKSP